MTMKKKYKIKPTLKQRIIIKEYWGLFCEAHDFFYGDIARLEKSMEKETGIKGIEFIRIDGDFIGVGSADREMALIQLNPTRDTRIMVFLSLFLRKPIEVISGSSGISPSILTVASSHFTITGFI